MGVSWKGMRGGFCQMGCFFLFKKKTNKSSPLSLRRFSIPGDRQRFVNIYLKPQEEAAYFVYSPPQNKSKCNILRSMFCFTFSELNTVQSSLWNQKGIDHKIVLASKNRIKRKVEKWMGCHTILRKNNWVWVVSAVLWLNGGISKLNPTVCFDRGDQIREAGSLA